MLNRKLLLILVIIFTASVSFGMIVHAASSATIAFLDTFSQPQYQVTASGLVDDGGGCDFVTMMMTDATGGITDIDTFCLDSGTGVGSDFTDWGSFESGYVAAVGPITYTVFDTAPGDACNVNENSAACAEYLLSGAVLCIGEAYYQPPEFPEGTAYPVCAAKTSSGSGCSLTIPDGSVVGDLPLGAQAYYEPGNVAPGVVLNAGTYIVIGQDASETYYKVVLSCDTVWVLKDAMQPSYAPPQNGAPLPTRVVS